MHGFCGVFTRKHGCRHGRTGPVDRRAFDFGRFANTLEMLHRVHSDDNVSIYVPLYRSVCMRICRCVCVHLDIHLGRLANALEDLAADVDVLLALFVFVGPDDSKVQGRLLLCVIDLDDVRVHVDMSYQQRDTEVRTQ